MSDLLLNITRLGFLAMLWWFIFSVTAVLRRDLLSPRDAKPLTVAKTGRIPNRRSSLRRNKSEHRLIITTGPLAGTSIPLGTTPVTIGRAPDSAIVLNDDFISTHHAVVSPHGEQWILQDLGSTNGTVIGGKKITEPTILQRKVPVLLGSTTLELR